MHHNPEGASRSESETSDYKPFLTWISPKFQDIYYLYLIAETGGKLDVIADKIVACDKQSESVSTESDTVVVESLLETVKQVQSEYQVFQKDLTEVKILQRQVHAALHEAASELQEAIKSLRSKLIAHHVFPNSNTEETET